MINCKSRSYYKKCRRADRSYRLWDDRQAPSSAYEYRVKTAVLGTLKRYSILFLALYLEWYNAYSILYSGGAH
jgi:hypothetical protein